MVYFISMTKEQGAFVGLAKMREEVGLTARGLAHQLGISHTAVLKWEKAGRVNKTEFLAPLAEIFGVTIEELLGQPAPRRNAALGGKLGEVFREVAELPRSQQSKVIEMARGFIALHSKSNGA